MKKILFVCTGNTCRSPMAMALFNRKASEKGLDMQAVSAGLYADGSPLSENARRALEIRGITGIKHNSVQLDAMLLDECDYIFGISARHASCIEAQYPGAKGKVFPFPADIPDPFGQELDVYLCTLEEIEKGVDAIISAVSEE